MAAGILAGLGLMGFIKIVGLLGAIYTGHKLIDLLIPGNEERLMEAMRKLKVKKDSAEAQFLKKITLGETLKLADEYRDHMARGGKAGGNLLQAIMMQSTASDRDIPMPGKEAASDVGGPHEQLQPDSSRGPISRQDVEGAHAALASLREKGSADHEHPPSLRMTGPPSRG